MPTNGVYILNNNLKPSVACYDLIKCFESFRARPYYCAGGKLTIGYGTTRGVTSNMVVTHEKAIEMLHQDVEIFSESVNKYITAPLNQNQFDAIVSWVYNIGEGNFKHSTFLRFINSGKYDEAGKELLKWHFIKKMFSSGLANRREAEYALYTKPMYDC